MLCTKKTIPTALLLGAILCTGYAFGNNAEVTVYPPPMVQYSVAAPRAAIIGEEAPRVAAAENFPREPGTIRVAAGKRLLFHLSPNSEAVWYGEGTSTAEWELDLYVYRPADDGAVEHIKGSDNYDLEDVDDQTEGDWKHIGEDSTDSKQTAPAIARPQLGILIPGQDDERYTDKEDFYRVFLLRATVKTILPGTEDGRVYKDDVYVRVVVTNDPIILHEKIEDPVSSTCPDLDNIAFRDQEEFSQIFLSTDFTGTGRTDLSDLAALADNWLEKESSLSDTVDEDGQE